MVRPTDVSEYPTNTIVGLEKSIQVFLFRFSNRFFLPLEQKKVFVTKTSFFLIFSTGEDFFFSNVEPLSVFLASPQQQHQQLALGRVAPIYGSTTGRCLRL